jgi:hypothetical protein
MQSPAAWSDRLARGYELFTTVALELGGVSDTNAREPRGRPLAARLWRAALLVALAAGAVVVPVVFHRRWLLIPALSVAFLVVGALGYADAHRRR